MNDYIEWIRARVGHDQIFLNFSGACITNDEGKILFQKRTASGNEWGFPGGPRILGPRILGINSTNRDGSYFEVGI